MQWGSYPADAERGLSDYRDVEGIFYPHGFAYLLVDDVDAAARTAQEAGGVIAHPPLEIPGHGRFAIYILGGIQHGLWQD